LTHLLQLGKKKEDRQVLSCSQKKSIGEGGKKSGIKWKCLQNYGVLLRIYLHPFVRIDVTYRHRIFSNGLFLKWWFLGVRCCRLISIQRMHAHIRLKAKKGAGKAIIATSRKFLENIYKTLKNNWMFENFNEFNLEKTG
jgi:hypothetical protein